MKHNKKIMGLFAFYFISFLIFDLFIRQYSLLQSLLGASLIALFFVAMLHYPGWLSMLYKKFIK